MHPVQLVNDELPLGVAVSVKDELLVTVMLQLVEQLAGRNPALFVTVPPPLPAKTTLRVPLSRKVVAACDIKPYAVR
jgi:hypothetical protein